MSPKKKTFLQSSTGLFPLFFLKNQIILHIHEIKTFPALKKIALITI